MLALATFYGMRSIIKPSLAATKEVAICEIYPLAFFTSSISGGTMSNKFPTTA